MTSKTETYEHLCEYVTVEAEFPVICSETQHRKETSSRKDSENKRIQIYNTS